MKFLSQETFLDHYKNTKSRTFTEFFNKAQVKTSTKTIPLKEYIKDKDIHKDNIKLLFENIQHRNEYLSRFYNVSLSIDLEHFSISSQKPMKNKEFNNNEEINYKNIIRNMHYKDILQRTQSGFINNPSFLDVLDDLYLHNIIDYKILTPSSLFYIKEGRIGSVFSSFYFRASIMNPYLVYSMNESLLKGTKIFTPTLGWTSYLYGFLESPKVLEYVGTDVIPQVCKKTAKFAKQYYPNKMVDIYCEPSENLNKNRQFLTKYREHFDVVFFSPPYYKLEKYKGGKQSTEQYKTYEEWLEKYWEQTIQLCHKVLKKGGKLCYILSGYGSQNTAEQYDLITDMNKITKKYFHYVGNQQMYNKDVHVTEHKETNERIIIFRK